jgi:5'-nucleotidase / UDP-sugar diphosphatase
VGGHSHTKVVSPVVIGHTIIVQAWEHAKALGVLDLEIEDGKIVNYYGHLEEIRPEPGKEDKPVSELVEKYEQSIDAALAEIVGEANADLDGENVRERETNLGDLIADIMRSASGSDATIINGGGIRAGIKRGEIKRRDVSNVLPFDNYIVAVKLSGRQVREALEYGVSGIEGGSGRFPQVSGITFSYLRSASPGARVKDILITGSPIEPDREYIVATNDFIAAGGDGYKVFGEAAVAAKGYPDAADNTKVERPVYCDSGRWLRDVVIEYIQEKKVITPSTDGRIMEIP